MPWIVPSHQAPVLRLARTWPRHFSGLGLVLGTVAPDLFFILPLDARGSPASHSWSGQLYLTLPLVLGLHRLLTALVLPWLLPHLPGGPPLHLHELARSRPAAGFAANARVALSGLLGGSPTSSSTASRTAITRAGRSRGCLGSRPACPTRAGRHRSTTRSSSG